MVGVAWQLLLRGLPVLQRFLQDRRVQLQPAAELGEAAPSYTGNAQYRRQRRGGKGLRDIRTTERNGPVIDILSVSEDDEVLMVTAVGKIQRVRAREISQVGRNTQGVRIIRLDEGDRLVSCARIPSEILEGS